MRTRMYGGVRGRRTKVGGKLLLFSSYSIFYIMIMHIIAIDLVQLIKSFGNLFATRCKI